jgi:hypothetical protein
VVPNRREMIAIAALFIFVGGAAWAFYLWSLRRVFGSDWMVFYTAVRAYFDGHLAVIFDPGRFQAALSARFSGWLSAHLPPHPWVYPPTFLLLFLPFGLLPANASVASFELASFAAAAAAARLYASDDARRTLLLGSLLLNPATPFNVMVGQNAFWTGALLLGGLGLLARAPVLAGLLLGIVTAKPQLFLMVPVALIAARNWRALASAGVTTLTLALASLSVFGLEPWRAWLELAAGRGAAYAAWLAPGRLLGQSVFAVSMLLGASSTLANLLQAAAAATAAACVYSGFRRDAPGELKIALLLAATMAAAPQVSASDAVLLGLAASLFLSGLPTAGPRGLYAAAAALLWISPLFNPPALITAGLATPLLILLFMGCVLRAMGRQSQLSESAP